ncbi:MAG: D-alanyl-D-alanine carboxypeptidase [Clostridia bacterium]|nr:D-alanyl-D-alanine carboxypeptidase [Clostridia bacterium]
MPYCAAKEKTEDPLDILAPSALLVEKDTGAVLYEKEPNERRSCASITKIMTMLLVMEAIDSGDLAETDLIVTSEHASSMGGSDIWLEPGESMTVSEMIKAVMISSANDAAVALAEHIAGSEEAFVDKMNERARELSMNNTVFKNCNGLDEEGHLTTAYDISLMTRELMKHKGIFKYSSIWLDYLRDGKTQLVNTNKLLKTYQGITGLKTGTTDDAKCCIVATAKRKNLNLIAIILGAENSKDRFADASKLLDFGFANFISITPNLKDNALPDLKVKNGIKSSVKLSVDFSKDILIEKGAQKDITHFLEVLEETPAPIKKNDIVGKLIYKNGDEVIAEYDVKVADDVEKISFIIALKSLLYELIKL